MDQADENKQEVETIDFEEEPEEFADEFEKAKYKALRIVKTLLAKMKVKASVSARIMDPEDDHDEQMVIVEITGKDLSILIGRRAETLNALQYITSLMLNQQLDHWMPLIIDVQGYRFRRERQLRQMARRAADQVVATSRKQVLEPMPPNERRIIHIELRYHPFVTTESVGEEPTRKITIFLKPKE
jgi:spoIIIJ-associated protein